MSDRKNQSTFEVGEWSATPPIELSSEDQRLLRTQVNQAETRIKIQYRSDGKAILHTTQHVGVVSLPSGITLQIEPKAAAGNLLHLLRYANGIKGSEISERIGLAEGRTFINVLGELFIDELQKLLERGLSRSYESARSQERFLRGRLQLEEQVRNQGPIATSFSCEFDTFTADTTLNQAVLAATVLLSELVDSGSLTNELQAYRTLLRRHVTERVVSTADLDQVQLTRLNQHYEPILRLSRLLLEGSFVEDIKLGHRESYSLLIDMNRVYERVIERAFSDLVDTYPGWTVRTQRSNQSLLQGEPRVELIPDIIVEKDSETQLVADAKWKRSRSNSDLYQLVAYELAEHAPGALIYPDIGGALNTTYTVRGGDQLDLVEFDTSRYAPTFEDFHNLIRDSAQSVLGSLINGLPERRKSST